MEVYSAEFKEPVIVNDIEVTSACTVALSFEEAEKAIREKFPEAKIKLMVRHRPLTQLGVLLRFTGKGNTS